MGIPAPTELLLILAIVVLLFGSKRIPEVMSGIAHGIKTFKKSMESDDSDSPPPVTQPSSPPVTHEAKTSQSDRQETVPK